MVVNISAEHIYLSVIAILLVLQVYQFSLIVKMRAEIAKIWMQIAMVALSLATKIQDDEQKANGTR